jgi:hypothetical protein
MEPTDVVKGSLENLNRTIVWLSSIAAVVFALTAFQERSLSVANARVPLPFVASVAWILSMGGGIYIIRLLHLMKVSLSGGSEESKHARQVARLHPCLVNPCADTPGIVGIATSYFSLALLPLFLSMLMSFSTLPFAHLRVFHSGVDAPGWMQGAFLLLMFFAAVQVNGLIELTSETPRSAKIKSNFSMLLFGSGWVATLAVYLFALGGPK